MITVADVQVFRLMSDIRITCRHCEHRFTASASACARNEPNTTVDRHCPRCGCPVKEPVGPLKTLKEGV